MAIYLWVNANGWSTQDSMEYWHGMDNIRSPQAFRPKLAPLCSLILITAFQKSPVFNARSKTRLVVALLISIGSIHAELKSFISCPATAWHWQIMWLGYFSSCLHFLHIASTWRPMISTYLSMYSSQLRILLQVCTVPCLRAVVIETVYQKVLQRRASTVLYMAGFPRIQSATRSATP
jgi:hypothetical protein